MNTDIVDTDVTRPPIVLCRSDHQRLTRLAMERLLSMPREAGALLQEVHRATVVPDDEIASDAIWLGSGVSARTTADPSAASSLCWKPSRTRPAIGSRS